jgi:hypothetical protein
MNLLLKSSFACVEVVYHTNRDENVAGHVRRK